MECFVCTSRIFETVFEHKKLRVFSALKTRPFSESLKFDAILYRCTTCGFVQQHLDTPLKHFLASFYKKEESFFTSPPAASIPDSRTASTIDFLNRVTSRPVKSILEIGAYDGYFLELLRRNFKSSTNIGIEISKRKNYFPKITILHEYYPTKKVEEKKFDLIVLMNVLEHVFTPRTFMSAVRENMEDDGQMLIEIPNEQWAFDTGMISFQHQHISYFTPKTIKLFLTSLGFKISALYTKDKDRMLLVCVKAKTVQKSRIQADLSSQGYGRRVAALLKKISIVAKKNQPLGLYGACNFTHNVVQLLPDLGTLYVFDGDIRKKGLYMSNIKKPVDTWEGIDSSGADRVLIMPLGFTSVIYTFLKKKYLKTPIEKLFSR